MKATTIFCLSLALFQCAFAADKVICYWSSWAQPGPDQFDANLCTHVNYAFGSINGDGSLQASGDGLWAVSNMKQRNPNLKAILSVGGWGANIFGGVSTDPGQRANLARTSIAFFQQYNFDGLDIDWEYPDNAQNYNALLSELKNEFNQGGYLLTAAVSASPWGGQYDVPTIAGILDVINVMTYDYHGSWDNTVGFNSPLYSGDGINADASINAWIGAGAPPNKLAIGVAFYGRGFLLSDPGQFYPGAPSAGQAGAGTFGYQQICNEYGNAEHIYDDGSQVPYLHRDNIWIGYDNPQSVAAKARYAQDKGLAGVLIWSIDTDDFQQSCGGERQALLRAIKNVI